jgi:hypothetical protein
MFHAPIKNIKVQLWKTSKNRKRPVQEEAQKLEFHNSH